MVEVSAPLLAGIFFDSVLDELAGRTTRLPASVRPIAVIFWRLNPQRQRTSWVARRLSGYLHERIIGIAVVKASVWEQSETTRFEKLTKGLANLGAVSRLSAGTYRGWMSQQ